MRVLFSLHNIKSHIYLRWKTKLIYRNVNWSARKQREHAAWDQQLPALIDQEEGRRQYEYQHSTFFAEQLTAFEVYLSSGPTERNPPDQLPIVLQVLLSQAHRLRALILLSKFLDLGPWAVHLALSIGIFPYVVVIGLKSIDML